MGKILAEIAGRIATLLAFYDDDFYNVLCDAEGHLQVDVLSSPLPTDAATEPTLDEIMDRLGDETSPASGSANAQLADIVARIGALSTPAGGSTNKLLTDALTALKLIDNLYGALHSQHTDELDVIVESSALPTDAATEPTLGLVKDYIGALTSPASGSANAQLADIVARMGALSTPAGGSTNKLLTDALTALQLIDNLYGALQSQANDRLIVRGEDQLYSYQLGLNNTRTAAISGAGGYIDSNNPGAGVIWKVTSVAVQNQTSPFTRVEMMIRIAAADYHFHSESFAWGAGSFASVQCEKWLSGNDIIRVYLAGGLGGDTIKISLTGHIMTVET